MEHTDFLKLVDARLSALEDKLHQFVDRQLTDEIRKSIQIAEADLPFALAKARYILEVIVLDIYKREFQGDKPKPLFDMIEALCERKGLFSKKIATDVHYIRINGNLIVHAQGERVEITAREVEVILLMIMNLVEWYLVDYLPVTRGELVAEPSLEPLPPCPYRGLQAFREEDADLFFGRESEAEELAALTARSPFVAVVGASGSGKSSLVFAGLLPRLRTSGDWLIIACRPRRQPFYELAHALCQHLYEDTIVRLEQTNLLSSKLETGAVGLGQVVTELLARQGKRRCLLIVDQFEELYTQTADKAMQRRFAGVLLQSLADGAVDLPLTTLVTLRVDFLSPVLEDGAMVEAVNRFPPKYLHPIAEERLRAVIEGPARKVGVSCQELLVERILRDLGQGGEGVSLPLLEFNLEQLWLKLNSRQLTHLAYEETGGIYTALARHADEVLSGFSPEDRERVRHVLVQLVRPGTESADTRQVVAKSDIGAEL
jgi:hypothetical protein